MFREGLGKGVKVQAGERTIRLSVGTKPNQNGSRLVSGAALVNQALILEDKSSEANIRCSILPEEPVRARGLVALGRGQPAAGIPPPRASQPSSARQCPAERRAGRGGRARCGRR